MDSQPRLVLVRPVCAWCGGDATVETMTVFGVADTVCDSCSELIAKPDAARVPLVNWAGRSLPSAAEATGYLATQSWTFAKSRPSSPHEYVLLRRSTSPWDHLRTVAYIRAFGEPRPWRWPPAIHHYWRPGDGREYWTMREQDSILNRRELADDE